MVVSFTAIRVSWSGVRRQSAGEEVMALTSETVSMRKRACGFITYKKGDWEEEGREHLSPLVCGLGVSLTAQVLALPGCFTVLVVILAEGDFGGGCCCCGTGLCERQGMDVL